MLVAGENQDTSNMIRFFNQTWAICMSSKCCYSISKRAFHISSTSTLLSQMRVNGMLQQHEILGNYVALVQLVNIMLSPIN